MVANETTVHKRPKMTQTLTTIGNRTAFNNEQSKGSFIEDPADQEQPTKTSYLGSNYIKYQTCSGKKL